MYDCPIEILDKPTIQVIPTQTVFKDIVCTTPTCHTGLQEAVKVSTTHNFELGMAIEVGAEPFGVGVKFTASVT